ncbi:MAG: magnesium chelatase domain-containing protein, partial [Pseudomonadota bacterium]
RVSEPAADLAVAAAILSAHRDRPIPAETVVFGEVSLSSAVRPVGQAKARIKEARKLGFTGAWAPSEVNGEGESGMSVVNVKNLDDLTELIVPTRA